MNIQEASKQTGISKDMIRFYEKKGLIHPKRSENHYRDYSIHDLHLLILIKQYNSLGIPLSTIQSMFLNQNYQEATNQFSKQIDQLRQDAEWAYVKYKNAKDLFLILQSYKSNQNYDTGVRKTMYYLNNQNISEQTIPYFSSGIARAVYRISLESLKQSTYPVDTGLLFAYNHPSDNYAYQEISEHIFYRTIVEVPSNQTISIKQLKQIIQTMHTRGYQECGDIFIYQALTTGNDYGIDIICVEIIAQKTT